MAPRLLGVALAPRARRGLGRLRMPLGIAVRVRGNAARFRLARRAPGAPVRPSALSVGVAVRDTRLFRVALGLALAMGLGVALGLVLAVVGATARVSALALPGGRGSGRGRFGSGVVGRLV